jgi:hypothetical protein
MITPRFSVVAFVALLGIVNVSGLPVWSQQPVRVVLCLVGCMLMALSARLVDCVATGPRAV